jgi:hypothetical protein
MPALIPPNPPPNWQGALKAAQRQDNPQELGPLVTAAEYAIFARLQDLNGKVMNENDEIMRAVATWREIQVTKLDFPQWSGEGLYLASREDAR